MRPELQIIWRKTHRDYKGTLDGVRSILVLRSGGTTLVPLTDLTDEEIKSRLPKGNHPAPFAKTEAGRQRRQQRKFVRSESDGL